MLIDPKRSPRLLGRVQNNMVSSRPVYSNVASSCVAKPQRAPPKVYQILLKTHKITIFLTAHQSSTVASLKEEALSALTSPVLSTPSGAPHIPTAPGEDDDMMDENESTCQEPRVQSTEDFELCRAVKDKGKSNSLAPPVSYDTLDPSMPIKGTLSHWETLYVQFKDEDGMLFAFSCSDSLY